MIEQCFVGIDVSQDWLDVLLLPQATGFSVANNEAGWNALIARLRDLPVAAIGLEPSGGYERGVIRALLTASLSVRRINPNRLRQFARARGALAKNDRLDARLIAAYVATMPTHVVRHDPAAARIAEIVTVRRQLCDEHVAIENQAGVIVGVIEDIGASAPTAIAMAIVRIVDMAQLVRPRGTMAAAGLIHTTIYIRAFVAPLAGIMAPAASMALGSTVAGDTPTGDIAAATVAVCTGDGRSPCGAGTAGASPAAEDSQRLL